MNHRETSHRTCERSVIGMGIGIGSLILCALLTSCDGVEPCGVPGVTEACACGAAQGARVCMSTNTWAECNCSGAIGLPNPVLTTGGSGGMSGGTHGGSSGGGAGGTSGGTNGGGIGGTSMSGTTGGSQPPTDGGPPDDDSGIEPAGSGGMSGGSGGMNVDDASTIDPNQAYLGCASTADCQAHAECVITPGFPTSASFCAPECMVNSDCPLPDGTYEAKPTCVTGYCKIDCTPVLFAPLLTCPTGMTCVAPLGGLSYCHDDGV